MESFETYKILEKTFIEKLKAQISNEGQLLISGKEVKVAEIGYLNATVQPSSFDSNELLFQNSTKVHIAGAIEIYPIGDGGDVGISEAYSFEAIGIRVIFNTETKEFEFEKSISLSNFIKR